MNISSLKSSDLRVIAGLLKRKEKLERQISALDKKLANYGGGSSGTTGGESRRGRPPGKKKAVKNATRKASGKKRAPRGQLKGKILSALKKAGPAGLTVKELVSKTGSNDASLRVWFSTTGGKLKEIKKVKKEGMVGYSWAA